ncbi:MAG: glutamine--fructose-6-phosphate transaminase (isomerizing) [Deltaproteobacteria bacterium]|nr:glutamine--fructose-6-phosphate transaminase (isomerizing) [Deltaproteobacteria bacterium]
MCGIVAYVGPRPAQQILIDGLRRLEYRGYDSAGLATVDGGRSQVVRAVGKLDNLVEALARDPVAGSLGVGHTRWATHGRPSEENAHPHAVDGVIVVHNGIIENHLDLRHELQQRGRVFKSETDTEIFGHLIAIELQGGAADLESAVRQALARVQGAYAIAVISERHPGQIAVAKLASPLLIGLGAGESLVASDIPAILPTTRSIVFLEEGELALVEAGRARITTLAGQPVERPARHIDWTPALAEKGGFKHFMHKEIVEQPRALIDTLRGRISRAEGQVFLDGLDVAGLSQAQRLVIIACGTSYHAGLVGKYLIETLTRLPVDVELASEYRYRDPIVLPGDAAIAISQSGETADTLAAMRELRRRGGRLMAICNVVDSAVAREAGDSLGVLYTHAGPEIGVASTKAFTTQILCLHLIALAIGRARDTLDLAAVRSEVHALSRLPKLVEAILEDEKEIEAIAHTYHKAHNFLFLGRGHGFPIALEGALKLKEISYIHAEGYAAGEMKHGPIALIDESLPVVCIATQGAGYDKLVSNIEEVRARDGRIIAIASDGDSRIAGLANEVIFLPASPPRLEPILATVPLQLLAYHIADFRGTDVDQPRNLAKSVTVE